MSNMARDFASLFAGNLRSFGQWDPASGEMITEKREVTLKDYENHITGRMGLGIVPVTDGATCAFGAIDVDKHDDPEDVDLRAIAEKIEKF